MKKLIISLFAAVMMTTGLVAFTGTAASAAQCDRYYGQCIKPSIDIDKPEKVKAGSKATVTVTLSARGDAVVQGSVKLIVKRAGRPFFTSEKTLNGRGRASITTPKLPKGKYQVTVKFIPRKGTPWLAVQRVSSITAR